jgi:hypothetical protein
MRFSMKAKKSQKATYSTRLVFQSQRFSTPLKCKNKGRRWPCYLIGWRGCTSHDPLNASLDRIQSRVRC